jgi:hypothetical protein
MDGHSVLADILRSYSYSEVWAVRPVHGATRGKNCYLWLKRPHLVNVEVLLPTLFRVSGCKHAYLNKELDYVTNYH